MHNAPTGAAPHPHAAPPLCDSTSLPCASLACMNDAHSMHGRACGPVLLVLLSSRRSSEQHSGCAPQRASSYPKLCAPHTRLNLAHVSHGHLSMRVCDMQRAHTVGLHYEETQRTSSEPFLEWDVCGKPLACIKRTGRFDKTHAKKDWSQRALCMLHRSGPASACLISPPHDWVPHLLLPCLLPVCADFTDGVASNPAPSYVLPAGIARPASRKALGPGHLNQPNPLARPSSPLKRGQTPPWSDSPHLNSPNTDYLLSRQLRPDPLPARPPSPLRGGLPGPGSPTKARPQSALQASFEHRMSASSRPMTSSPHSPPMAGSIGLSATTGAAVGLGTQPGTAGVHGRPSTAELHAVLMGAAVGGPTQTTITAAGASPSRPLSPSKQSATGASTGGLRGGGALMEEPTEFIRDVQEDEGLTGEPFSRPMSAMPLPRPGVASSKGSPAAGRGAAAAASLGAAVRASMMGTGAAARAGLTSAMSTRGGPPVVAPGTGSPAGYASSRGAGVPVSALPKKREGFVETVPGATLTGVVGHMRATSASLRRYNLPPASSALSPVATTFARKPKAPHRADPR